MQAVCYGMEKSLTGNLSAMCEKKLDLESNALDCLRLYAAFSVMLLHFTGYFLILSEVPNPFLSAVRKLTLFFPGVVVLFAISGFLIAYSFERSQNRRVFFCKRILRLYPELWGCTLFNLIVLIVLARDRLNGSILLWLATQIVGIANTPSCLKDFATGSVNGALWTIFVEIQMYILVFLFYRRLKKFNAGGWCLLLLLSAVVNLVCGQIGEQTGELIRKVMERTFLPYLTWFLSGVFCYCRREKVIPLLRRWCLPLLALYAVLYRFRVFSMGYYCGIMTSVLCPFIVIGLGFLLPKVRFRHDITYGCFLYHWIVLNIIVHFNLINKWPWYLSLLLFIGSSLILSWLSMKLIGKKAAKFLTLY